MTLTKKLKRESNGCSFVLTYTYQGINMVLEQKRLDEFLFFLKQMLNKNIK